MNISTSSVYGPESLDKNVYSCDYLIIGSGAGGSVAASTLSKNSDVILLEEGLHYEDSFFRGKIRLEANIIK